MTNEVPETITIESKNAFALAFQGMGGIPKLIAWGRTHRTAFYQIYSKLIPLQVAAQVDVKHDNGEAARAKLEDAFKRLIDAEREERAERLMAEAQTGIRMIDGVAYRRIEEAPSNAVVIEHAPQQPRVVEQEPPVRSVPRLVTLDDGAPNNVRKTAEVLTPAQARERAMAPSHPPRISDEPSTTEKYLEWARSGRRDPWGNYQ
jgi:hypothetical protein